MESSNGLKRRLSLSEVLNNQKRVRSDQQQKVMRSSFGGQATPNAGQSLLKANNGAGLIPNLGLPNGITLTPQLGKDASPPSAKSAAANISSLSKGELPELPNEPEEVVVRILPFLNFAGFSAAFGIAQTKKRLKIYALRLITLCTWLVLPKRMWSRLKWFQNTFFMVTR